MVQCINTSSTRWTHRSPEGYINNVPRTSLTPASHFIGLIWSGEKLHPYVRVCVHVLWIFYLCSKEVNLIPEAFSTARKVCARTMKNTCIAADKETEETAVRHSKTRSGGSNWFIQEVNILFETWMDDQSWDSCEQGKQVCKKITVFKSKAVFQKLARAWRHIKATFGSVHAQLRAG